MTARGGSGTPSASTPSILQDDLFLGLFHASPVAMAITRMDDATFVDVNEAFRREIGYELGEVVGRSALDLGLWADPAERESMVRALREHGSADVTARFRVKSGDLLTGAFSARVIEHRGERLILTTIPEPLERQVAELARRRRDAILDAVAFAAQHFPTACGWDEDIQDVLGRLGEAADVSRAYIFENLRADEGTVVHNQRYEWAAEGIVRQIDAPFLQGFSFHDQGTGHWEAMLRRGEPVQGHVRELPGSAREVFRAQQILSLVLVPVFVRTDWWGFVGFDDCLTERQWTTGEIDALKAAAGMLGAAIGRQRAESRLRETEAKYRTLVERVPAVTWIDALDEAMTTLYISPQIETLLGISPIDYQADPGIWVRHLHPEDRDGAVAAYTRGRDSGEPFSFQYRMIRPDGRVVWIRNEAVTVRDEAGSPRFLQGVALDITERKLAEEQLQESLELLGRADWARRMLLTRVVKAQEEERRRIAADIHDDSLQKMAAVGLRLQTLHRRDLDAEDERLLEQLEQTVELAIARLRHLMFELRPPALDRDGLGAALHQHLDEVAAEVGFEPHLENRLVTEPPRGTRAIAYRIAQEALVNVRKHAGAHRVDVLLESREGGLLVRIRDDGRGFSMADAESAHGHMGLSAMRERADLAGGWCRVEGAPGAGTTVEFWLPAGAADGPDD